LFSIFNNGNVLITERDNIDSIQAPSGYSNEEIVPFSCRKMLCCTDLVSWKLKECMKF